MMRSTAGGAGRTAQPQWPGLKHTICGTAALAMGWFAYAMAHILWPSQGDLERRVDAVVSLAPQEHRLPMAQRLVADGVTETLTVSYFDHDKRLVPTSGAGDSVPLAHYCNHARELCFRPADAAVGEVDALAELARKSWGSLTVVTNQHHVSRTRFIFDRCLGDEVDINVVYAHRDYGVSGTAWRVLYENAAFFKAVYDVTVRC